jgi:putative ABC transport system permease protein
MAGMRGGTSPPRRPPRLPGLVLKLVLFPEECREFTDDLAEIHRELAAHGPGWKADLWYGLRVFESLPRLFADLIVWRYTMIKNYLMVAWRNIRRRKAYSFINLLGFSLGMACCIIILLYVRNERSYDSYHEDIDRIYRISIDIQTRTANRLFAPISDTAGPALEADFPQVEAVARIWPQRGILVKRGDIMSYEDRVMFADRSLFQVLTIPLIRGAAETALAEPGTLVISETLARKYFGHADPMAGALNINGQDFKITGVTADCPENTHLKYGLIASMATVADSPYMDNWHSTMFYTYLKLKPEVDAKEFSRLVGNLADKYVGSRLEAWGDIYRYFLQPVRGLHLAAPLRYEIEPPAKPVYLTILSLVGLATLLIACLNFMNLATARSANRAREVGLRKVVGAEKRQLVGQFLGEAVLAAVASLFLALAVVRLAIPFLNRLTGSSLQPGWLLSPALLGAIAAAAVLVGVASGLYPALVLSSYRPTAVLTGTVTRGRSGLVLRTVLVVVQFSISSAVIVDTLFMHKQFQFMRNQNLGFDKEQKLVVPIRGGISVKDNYAVVKDAFLENPAVKGAALSSTVPGRGVSNFAIKIVGEADDRSQSMFHMYFDHDFVPLYDIPMASGRPFRGNMATDVAGAFLINEAAMKAFGWSKPEEALGKRLQTGFGGRILPIIGVTRDFHYRGLQAPVEPLVMEFNPELLRMLTLQVNTTGLPATLAFVEAKWKDLFPGHPFESFFLDTDFDSQYQADERVSRIFAIFMTLGLVIACLGLFGLASFTTESRTREIGIRRVLGASSSGIVFMLSGQFARWVLAANLIAWPPAYLFIKQWLAGFASRTSVGAATFLFSGILILVIALATTSYQTVRAATANPARSLRHE